MAFRKSKEVKQQELIDNINECIEEFKIGETKEDFDAEIARIAKKMAKKSKIRLPEACIQIGILIGMGVMDKKSDEDENEKLK